MSEKPWQETRRVPHAGTGDWPYRGGRQPPESQYGADKQPNYSMPVYPQSQTDSRPEQGQWYPRQSYPSEQYQYSNRPWGQPRQPRHEQQRDQRTPYTGYPSQPAQPVQPYTGYTSQPAQPVQPYSGYSYQPVQPVQPYSGYSYQPVQPYGYGYDPYTGLTPGFGPGLGRVPGLGGYPGLILPLDAEIPGLGSGWGYW